MPFESNSRKIMTDSIDLLQLHLIRAGKEPSKAVESRYYGRGGDPAKHVQFGNHRYEDEVSVYQQPEFDEIDKALENWSDWMRKSEQLVAEYPSTASGMLAPSWIKDSEELYEALDELNAKATNAAIDSLKVIHREAIYIRFDLGPRVWRFRDHGSLYDAAKIAIAPELRKRSVI